MATIEQLLHTLHLLGWSAGDVAFHDPTTGRTEWLITCTRDDQTLVAKAFDQHEAWEAAVRLAAKVQRAG